MAGAGGSNGNRPSPEAMLALARRESASAVGGRLKIFLGAAPGVGKTYAMLSAAHHAVAEGINVLVGVVETHGRAETDALLTGLSVLPRRSIEDNRHIVMEFDLDAALANKPDLLLVDELAHSNPSVSRHPKRYMDVTELLEAGIDVWTTMNIQHLESLADVVSRITGVVVRERVPDIVLERADEIVVVDITPDDLIQRLKEGKVYLPENAKRAIDNFFKPANLTALRELALRRTADQVDGKMVSLLRESQIEGPWPTSERILVCIAGDERSEMVLRAASRLAQGLKATLVAVHLERVGAEATDPTQLKRIDDVLRLARRLGAETTRLSAQDLAGELLRYAQRQNITQIVIGRSGGGPLKRLRGLSLSDAVGQRARDIAVHLVTEGAPEGGQALAALTWPRGSLAGYGTAAGSVVAACALGMVLKSLFNLPNLSMLFLTAVLFCALTRGIAPAIAAAVLSFLAYNFFFIPPVYSFSIAEPQEFFALIIFLIVAIFTGGLAGRVREQAEAIRRRSVGTQRLYEFSRKLSGAASIDDLLYMIANKLSAAIDGTAIVLMPEAGELTIKSSWPPEDQLGTAEWAAARWSVSHREAAGRLTATLPMAVYQFRPLTASQGVVGSVGLAPQLGMDQMPAEDERVLEAMLDQAALAIERMELSSETVKAHALVESERLRSALLSSISHDLRTPLSAIVGSVTSLRTLGPKMSKAAQDDLLAAIEEEAGRLSRFVANLLDMTRLEAGALDLKRDWMDIGDVLRAAVERARRSFPRRRVELELAADLPAVRGDARLLEQVVFNLLDNADKYTDRDTPTAVTALRDGADVVVAVIDQGPGIPQRDLERIFEKFYRVAKGDGRAAGTGLGLSIGRGVITAMGGSIHAESPVRDGRGTAMVLHMPAAPNNSAVTDGSSDEPSHESTSL